MKIAVALSGGADSLASLILLKESGRELLPFHARFFPPPDHDPKVEEELSLICRKLGLSLCVLNLAHDFEKMVIKPFIKSYMSGLTPNPCALCNRQVKFGLILEKIKALGAQVLATGHYAGVSRSADGPGLWRAADASKDQSYFLSLVPVNIFEQVIFPLHEMSKPEVIEFLRQRNIAPPAREESNEICFIRNDYREFILSRVSDDILNKAGPVKNRQGTELGWHLGLWRHTQGQRKGLNIAHEHPLYVLEKDYKTNTLIVGARDELKTLTCMAAQINIHVDPALWPKQVFVQTRYRQKTAEAEVKIEHGRMLVSFCRPRDIPAPGQVAAVYSGQGQVLGAGTIIDMN